MVMPGVLKPLPWLNCADLVGAPSLRDDLVSSSIQSCSIALRVVAWAYVSQATCWAFRFPQMTSAGTASSCWSQAFGGVVDVGFADDSGAGRRSPDINLV